jgi:hypothetical protein
MQRSLLPSNEDRRELAKAIAALSPRILSIKENKKYVALQIGMRPYCNAISLSLYKDRVSFYIPSTQLRNEAIVAEFEPEPANAKTTLAEHKYYFNGLRVAGLQKHELLFKAIVKESVDYVLSQKPKGK